MTRYILINCLLLLAFALPTKCCLPSTNGECIMKQPTIYGGRLALIDEGIHGYDSLSPFAHKRVFVFQMPTSFFKGRNYRSKFGHHGIGRIWMAEEAPCGGERSHQNCPLATTEESICLDSSLPCYQTPPTYAEPEPLSFSDVTPTSITVTWPAWDETVDHGHGPIVEYRIQIRGPGEEDFTEIPKGRQLFHQFNDLIENTEYEFRIRIIRDHPFGDGSPSNVQTRTSAEVPPSYVNPQPLTFDHVTSTSVTVSWPEWNRQVDLGTGPVTGYKIMYRQHADNTWQSVETSDQSVQLTQLTEYTTYNVSIRLKYGSGQYTVMHNIQTFQTTCGELGDIDLQLSSSSESEGLASLVVNWSYRTMIDACSVTNQSIHMQQLDLDNCRASHAGPIEKVLGAYTRNYTEQTLAANSDFNVTLTVRTETKVYHKSGQLRTDSTKPSGKPIKIGATERENEGSVEFRWNDPECTERHGDIIRFHYVFRRTHRTDDITGSTTNKQKRFHYLTSGEGYSFEVKAATDKGTGPAASIEHTF
ncbi:receptor-type tyrosine-protein phosphatase F-like [Apostichopus japonicus]|uniref:receptor-type tyrosine-protein phosphatase F-like n=1 Tax=Stichopus japonicus TaxID=307972 RepID=UPI003AB796A4